MVSGILDDLLGEGWNCYGGDGNRYGGDTGWHSDCAPDQWQCKTVTRQFKLAFYLDPLTSETGALRVIPGSHRAGEGYCEEITQNLSNIWENLRIESKDVPCVALTNTPGDVVVFDHRIKHASFGGSKRRRMFCINVIERCRTEQQFEAARYIFRSYRDQHQVNWRQGPGWRDWVATLSPACQRRFDQSFLISDQVMDEVSHAGA